MCYACITLTTISVILDDPLENCCQKFICQKPLSKCLWSEEFSQLFTYSNTENCQSTKSGSTVYISRLTIQDLLEKLFLSSVSKWLLCLVSCSLLNCNDHCKLLQKTYQNPWYCFSMGWTRNIYISSVFSPKWFQKNMIQVINTRDLFIEQLTTDKKFREGRLGVFLSFKNWKCKHIPQAHC